MYIVNASHRCDPSNVHTFTYATERDAREFVVAAVLGNKDFTHATVLRASAHDTQATVVATVTMGE